MYPHKKKEFQDFIRAIGNQNLEYIREHIHSVVDFNTIEKPGMTLLTLAIEMENDEIIDLILEHGANINAPCHDGWTPLQIAIATVEDKYQIDLQENSYSDDIEPDLKIVEKILKYHPNLDIANDYGKRAQDMHPAWKELQELISKERQWQIDNNYQHK